MRPHSKDLRARILKALGSEVSSLVVAARFKVGASSVRKLRLKMERTGTFAAGAPPGRERLVRGAHEGSLARLVRETPDATLNVLRERLAAETGILVSEATMWRQLQRMGISVRRRSGR